MKRTFFNALLGAMVGIAIQYLLAIFISLKLNLGYFMPYIASLAEAAGGEMHAVLLEAFISGLLGAGIALALRFRKCSN